MDSLPWDSALPAWANTRPDIVALVQIGSRVQPGAPVDPYSDYDYQLISTRPSLYRDGEFTREIAPVWSFSASEAFGNITKVSAIYAGALEVDFVVLDALSLKVVATALRFPASRKYWPRPLRTGVEDLQRVAGLGWRMVKNSGAWESFYSRLAPYRRPMSLDRCEKLRGEFWTQMVWIVKKTQRGEYIAAVRALQRSAREITFEVMDEIISTTNSRARPEARYIEKWAEPEAVATLAEPLPCARQPLLDSIRAHAALFAAQSERLQQARSWTGASFAAVQDWVMAAR